MPQNPFFQGGTTGGNPNILGEIQGGGVTDHGLLTGLSDDDHTQYALLGGRAGGQTAYGGVAANEDLILHGTTHATKASSYVLLQPGGGFVGIAQLTPVNLLHVGDSEASISGPGIAFWSKANLTVVDSLVPALGVVSQIFGKANNSGGGINVGQNVDLQQLGTDTSAASSSVLVTRNSTGTIALAAGHVVDVEVIASGNVTLAAALWSAASMWEGDGVVGTVDILASIYVTANSRTSGVLTNNYGIYIEDQAGQGTNNWNLWSGGSGLNYFGGQIQSAVVTGTPPLIIASTTKVSNLNADLLDDQSGAYYLDSANFTGTNWTDLTDGGETTLHSHAGGAGAASMGRTFAFMGA